MVAASGGHAEVVNDILDVGTDAIDQQNLVNSCPIIDSVVLLTLY
jgi:hypothetical protein